MLDADAPAELLHLLGTVGTGDAFPAVRGEVVFDGGDGKLGGHGFLLRVVVAICQRLTYSGSSQPTAVLIGVELIIFVNSISVFCKLL
jgi:hypothetical protein